MLFAGVLAAQTVSYDIRPAEGSWFALEVFKSKLWEGRKHTLLYSRYHGSLRFDAEHPEQSSVRFALESASVRCVDDWVKPSQIPDIEKAARQTMAADKYPEITFQSTTITLKAPNQYEVRGTLTVRGVGKPVTLQVAAAPQNGAIRIRGSGQIKLSDYGLKAPTGAVGLFIGTKDAMNVTFDVTASASPGA